GPDEDSDRPLGELLCVFLVDVALEIAHEVGADAALAALIVEVERAAVGRNHADAAVLGHQAIEILLDGAFEPLGDPTGPALAGGLLPEGTRCDEAKQNSTADEERPQAG